MKFFSHLICLLVFICVSAHLYAQPSLTGGSTPQDSGVIFHLIAPLMFADGTVVETLAKDEIESLRDLPIDFGENVNIQGATLHKTRDDKVFVRTCREYDAARERGYSPGSTFDISMASFFKMPCGLLNALKPARLAKKRFISDAEVGIVNLALLPFEIFPENLAEASSWDQRDLETTYQQKIDTQAVVVTEKGKNVLVVQGFGMRQSLEEIVRADFNNDGIEDVLLFEGHHVRQGTYRAYGIIVLTRKSMDGKFEVLRPSDAKQSTAHPYWLQ